MELFIGFRFFNYYWVFFNFGNFTNFGKTMIVFEN